MGVYNHTSGDTQQCRESTTTERQVKMPHASSYHMAAEPVLAAGTTSCEPETFTSTLAVMAIIEREVVLPDGGSSPSSSSCSVLVRGKRTHDSPVAMAPASASVSDAEVPCFPSCMEDDFPTSNLTQTLCEPLAAPTPTTPARTSFSSRRNSRRRLGSDNQTAHESSSSINSGGSNTTQRATTLDFEDAAHHVLSPVDHTAAPPRSIVVDYDEGMPDRSRTALLLDEHSGHGDEKSTTTASATGTTAMGDCAPDACNPLDLLAIEELSLDETTRRRPRLASLTGQQPKTPRRGKSVILSTTTIAMEPPFSATATVVATKETTTKQHQQQHQKTTDDDELAPLPVAARCSTSHKLCLCEVRLHNSCESCWLVANGSVYDVTGVLDAHPAGSRSILRKAGGVDCTKDMKFHSKSARKMLEKCFIGKLMPCGEDPQADGGMPAACTIM